MTIGLRLAKSRANSSLGNTMPDLLIELRSEENPARPLDRSGKAARTSNPNVSGDRSGKAARTSRTNRSMRALTVELN
jgi:glycyl-tRNA synthetase beta subunit